MSSNGDQQDSETGLYKAIRKLMGVSNPDTAPEPGTSVDLTFGGTITPDEPDDEALVLGPTMREKFGDPPGREPGADVEPAAGPAIDHDVEEATAASTVDDPPAKGIPAESSSEIFDEIDAISADAEDFNMSDTPSDDDSGTDRITGETPDDEATGTGSAEGDPGSDDASSNVEPTADDIPEPAKTAAQGDDRVRPTYGSSLAMSAAFRDFAKGEGVDIDAELRSATRPEPAENKESDALDKSLDTADADQEQSDDPASAGAMPDPHELDETIRRVVREELSGEMGQRLSKNLQRMIRDEVARALFPRE